MADSQNFVLSTALLVRCIMWGNIHLLF